MKGKTNIKRIGILTGGGDCPGINAVIRAVAKTAINDYGLVVIGIEDGYQGLIECRTREITYESVSGILTQGGTILGTSNKANPFSYPVRYRGQISYRDLTKKAIDNFKKLELNTLICVGGDGTLTIAYRLLEKGLPIVGIPKTIDNDLSETDLTFGFDSALATATEAIDKLHTTAQSHHRVMVLEVMGRYTGWLALCSGIAGGGDVILIPEIPYDIEKLCEKVIKRNKKGRRFSIVVVAEGAKPKGGNLVIKKIVEDSPDPIRLGGIGRVVGNEIEQQTGLETRVAVLGHLQRGGAPSPFDRILATRFGSEAVNLAVNAKFGYMVSLKGDKIVSVSLEQAIKKLKKVPLNSSLITVAHSVGTCFGD